jgi:hypothetical protein
MVRAVFATRLGGGFLIRLFSGSISATRPEPIIGATMWRRPEGRGAAT